jgi:hypothetical protein
LNKQFVGTGIDEHRLGEVARLLSSALGDKVLGADPRLALERFEAAYAIANSQPRLPPPLPQIAAYRLAHMLMRFANSYDELKTIRSLFVDAEQLGRDALGPHPFTFRVDSAA